MSSHSFVNETCLDLRVKGHRHHNRCLFLVFRVTFRLVNLALVTEASLRASSPGWRCWGYREHVRRC